jgi:hypothetical protein
MHTHKNAYTNNTLHCWLQKEQFDYALGGKVSILDTYDGISLGLATVLISLVCHNLILVGAFGEAPDGLQTSHEDGMSAAAHSIYLVNCVSTLALAYVSMRHTSMFISVF